MIKVSTTGMVVSLKTDLRFPIPGQQGHGGRIIQEGTRTTPVGYLEGIFIKEGYRKNGYAKELLAECEAWAKDNGCQEFASDCELDNINSLQFHKAMNFTEANRIICFTKTL